MISPSQPRELPRTAPVTDQELLGLDRLPKTSSRLSDTGQHPHGGCEGAVGLDHVDTQEETWISIHKPLTQAGSILLTWGVAVLSRTHGGTRVLELPPVLHGSKGPGCSSGVEGLPSMHEALGSISSTCTPPPKKGKERGGGSSKCEGDHGAGCGSARSVSSCTKVTARHHGEGCLLPHLLDATSRPVLSRPVTIGTRVVAKTHSCSRGAGATGGQAPAGTPPPWGISASSQVCAHELKQRGLKTPGADEASVAARGLTRLQTRTKDLSCFLQTPTFPKTGTD